MNTMSKCDAAPCSSHSDSPGKQAHLHVCACRVHTQEKTHAAVPHLSWFRRSGFSCAHLWKQQAIDHSNGTQVAFSSNGSCPWVCCPGVSHPHLRWHRKRIPFAVWGKCCATLRPFRELTLWVFPSFSLSAWTTFQAFHYHYPNSNISLLHLF